MILQLSDTPTQHRLAACAGQRARVPTAASAPPLVRALSARARDADDDACGDRAELLHF
jgi:hypothetical protein